MIKRLILVFMLAGWTAAIGQAPDGPAKPSAGTLQPVAAKKPIQPAGLVVTPLPTAATKPDSGFDRYKIIIQKHPFGAPLPAVVEALPPSPPPPPDWIKDYRLSMLREARDGQLVAGLVIKKDNRPITLRVGGRHEGEGIELVSINMATSEIELKKDNTTLPLKVNPGDFKIGSKMAGKTKDRSDFARRMEERRKEMEKRRGGGGSDPSKRPERPERSNRSDRYSRSGR